METRMLLLRRSALMGRSFSSSSKPQTRIELATPALDVFRERLSNLGLLQAKFNVQMRVEGSSLVLEGEDAAVKSASATLGALREAKDEAQVVQVLTSVLGEGKRLRLPSKVMDKRGNGVSQLPALGDKTWVYRSGQDSAAYLWSDSKEQAEKDVERLTKWVALVREFQTARSHPTAEIEYHPSFSWLSRPEFQRLPIPGVLLDKSKTKARVWALDASAVETAKAYLSKPYRPVDAKESKVSLSIASSADNNNDLISRLYKLDQVAQTLEARGSEAGFKIEQASSNLVKFSTHWPVNTLLRAFTLAFAEDLKAARLNVGTVPTKPEVFARGLERLRASFPSDSVAVASGELKVAGGETTTTTTTTTVAWICASNNQLLNAAKLFFDPRPNLVQLRLEGFKDCHYVANEGALGRIATDLLGWNVKQRSLTHWGLDWFSTELAPGEKDASVIEKEFASLVAAPLEGGKQVQAEPGRVVVIRVEAGTSEKNAPSTPGQASKNPQQMVVAKDRATLERVLQGKPFIAPPVSKPTSATETTVKVTRIEPEKSVKTTRIEAPKQHAEKAADKTTRIEVPHSNSSGGEPVTVTRIQAPSARDNNNNTEDPTQKPVKITRIMAPSSMDNTSSTMEEGSEDFEGGGSDRRGSKVGKRRTPKGFNISKELSIPEQYVGSVIGRHGLTMRGVETKTKTAIAVEENHEEEGTFRVFISGSTEAHVELAAAELQAIIEQVKTAEKRNNTSSPDGSTTASRPTRAGGRRRGGRGRDGEGSGDGGDGDDRDSSRLKLKLFSPAYREKIWETFKSDPARWTDEELCKHFSVSEVHLRTIKAIMKHREAYLEANKDDEMLCSKELEQAMVAKIGETLDEEGEDPKPPSVFRRPVYRFVDPAAPAPTDKVVVASTESKKQEETKVTGARKDEVTRDVIKGNGFKVVLETRKISTSA